MKDGGNVPAHMEDATFGACGQRDAAGEEPRFSFLPLEGIVLLCMAVEGT